MQDDEARDRMEHEERGLTRVYVPEGVIVHVAGIPFESSGVYVWGLIANAELAKLGK
jgi:hypothetical protein